MIGLPSIFSKAYEQPEDEAVYQSVEDVPDGMVDEWIELHRDWIKDRFDDEITEWACEHVQEDPFEDEEVDDD